MTTKPQRGEGDSIAATAVKACGTAASVTCQGGIMGLKALFSGVKIGLTGNIKKDEKAVSKLEKALLFAGQSIPAIREDVEQRRTILKKKSPKSSQKEISSKISKDLIRLTAIKTGTVGGLSCLPGTIPGIGTVGTIAVSLTADIVHKLRTQIELCCAIAAAYEIEMDELELQATALIFVGISGSESTMDQIGDKFTKEMIDQVRNRVVTGLASSATKVAGKLSTTSRALRIIPFLGVPIGAYLNSQDTNRVGKQAHIYFSSISSD